MEGVPTQLVLYAATVLGAVALFFLMPRQAKRAPLGLRHMGIAGALLGVATLGAAWIVLCPLLRGIAPDETGVGLSGLVFYYVFSLLGVVSAVRVITHPRPVYSALWFVLVVIASSGLFLVLAAEFMALAMVIIYGGAILVTYMFVIMLATEPRASDDADDLPDYEQYAAEPLLAVATSFVLLAVLLSFMFQPQTPNPLSVATPDAVVAAQFDRQAAMGVLTATGDQTAIDPKTAVSVTNLQRVGLDLFQANPLAVELAGVILLLSLVGAVVIANTSVPLEEDASDPSRRSGRKPTDPVETGPEKPGVGGAEVVQIA